MSMDPVRRDFLRLASWNSGTDPSKWLSITQNSRVPQRLGAWEKRSSYMGVSLPKTNLEVQDTVGNWLYVG